MKKYVFYNSTTGDIKFIKKFTERQAMLNCASTPGLSCVLEDTVGFVLNKNKVKIDVDNMTLVPKTQPAVDPMIEIKHKRNMLLTASDWTQGADSPLTDAKKAEWATYRQALRDVPANNASATGHKAVDWPTPPE